jgi:hypothetical protein
LQRLRRLRGATATCLTAVLRAPLESLQRSQLWSPLRPTPSSLARSLRGGRTLQAGLQRRLRAAPPRLQCAPRLTCPLRALLESSQLRCLLLLLPPVELLRR